MEGFKARVLEICFVFLEGDDAWVRIVGLGLGFHFEAKGPAVLLMKMNPEAVFFLGEPLDMFFKVAENGLFIGGEWIVQFQFRLLLRANREAQAGQGEDVRDAEGGGAVALLEEWLEFFEWLVPRSGVVVVIGLIDGVGEGVDGLGGEEALRLLIDALEGLGGNEVLGENLGRRQGGAAEWRTRKGEVPGDFLQAADSVAIAGNVEEGAKQITVNGERVVQFPGAEELPEQEGAANGGT